MTHNLTYIGADPAVIGVVPLREGWPAANHEELDAEKQEAKIASGAYRYWRAEDGNVPQYNESTQPTPFRFGDDGGDAEDDE